MATQKVDGTRVIHGAVLQTGKIYKAGEEAELHAAMRGGSVQHLLDNGTISGDWAPTVDEPKGRVRPRAGTKSTTSESES